MIILFDLNKIEPIHISGIMDYHVHCDYSIDAEGSIEDFCEAALRRNLAEICFTTHFDSNPNSDGHANFIRVKDEKKKATIDNLAPYIDHVHKAHDIYYPLGLSVKLGVEYGYFEGCLDDAAKLKEAYPFDYFLCGIHEINNLPFCSRRLFTEAFKDFTAEEMVENYFNQVVDASESKLFNTIAHLEYYLKYGLQYYGDDLKDAYKPHLKRTWESLKKNNVALEVNSAAYRHGSGDHYPSIEIINDAKINGVAVIYLGSDAHNPEQIGADFEFTAPLVPDTVSGCED